MALQIAVEHQPVINRVVKLQVEKNYLLATDNCDCQYSRAAQVRVQIPEGTHKVVVNADRDILGHWTGTHHPDQFFYQHNAHQPFSKPIFESEQDATQLHFYRELSATQATQRNQLAPQTIADELIADTTLYFSAIAQGSVADYPLPTTTHQPPLRLYLQAIASADFAQLAHTFARINFTLQSDSQESAHMLYLPHTTFLDKTFNVAWQSVKFNKPFKSVALLNSSEWPISAYLAYKNRSKLKTDESGYIKAVNQSSASVLIDKLHRVLSGVTVDEPLVSSVILAAEMNQWQKRMQVRYDNFLTLYPLASERELSQLNLDLATVLANFDDVDSPELLLKKLRDNGMNARVKKLQALFAMQKQAVGQQGFLQQLAAQERWFDIEGYWLYRFIHFNETSAIVKLAQVLFVQNQFEMAAKWYWLAWQAGLIEGFPTQAYAAMLQQNYHKMLKNQKVKVPSRWFYWQPLVTESFNNSQRVLIHNRAFDHYLGAFKLNVKQPMSLTVTGPIRLKATVYGQKTTQWPQIEWLGVQIDQQRQYYPLTAFKDSLNLGLATDNKAILASPKVVVFDVPAGVHQVNFELEHIDGLISISEQNNLAQQWPEVTIAEHQPDNQRLMPSMVMTNEYKDADPLQLLQLANQIRLNGGQIDDGLLLRAIQLGPLPIELVSVLNALAGAQQSPWMRIINSGYGWQRLQSVQSSAGEQRFDSELWQPKSDYLRLQQALLTSKAKPTEKLLPTRNSEVIDFETLVAKNITLQLRQLTRLGETIAPTMVAVNLNGEITWLSISPSEPMNYQLKLRAGEHRIKIFLATTGEHNSRAWVFYSLRGDDNVSLLPPTSSKYYVSTKTNPLQMYVPQASWLRIDELNEQGQLTTSNRYIAQGQLLTLPAGESPSYFRVYHWQANKLPETEPLPLVPTEELIAPNVQQSYWLGQINPDWQLLDRYDMAEQEDGTWGRFISYRERQNFDEDEQTGRERFLQSGLRYRHKFSQWDSYIDDSFSLRRHRETGLRTLASENVLVWRESRYRDHSFRLNGYYQLKAPQVGLQGGWSLYGVATTGWRQYWDDNLDNRINLSVFGRVLSLSENEIYPGNDESGSDAGLLEDGLAIDDDVWSDYKEDNRFGLRVADTLQYSPWLDTKVRLSGSLTSNDNFNMLDPRRLFVSAGLRQYRQPWIMSFDLQHVRFRRDLADADITSNSQRSSMRFGLAWESWNAFGERWYVDGFINKDLGSSQASLGLSLNWDISQGQGYNDFAPSQLIFANLRRRDSFEVILSNQITSDDHD
jgi:hypothetical protein